MHGLRILDVVASRETAFNEEVTLLDIGTGRVVGAVSKVDKMSRVLESVNRQVPLQCQDKHAISH